MAATKALDALFHVDPPPAAKKLRELFYSIFFATDHTTHFYALAGPDFVIGPNRARGRAEYPRRGAEGRHGHRRQGAEDAPRRPPPDRDDGRPQGASQLGPARRCQPRHQRRATREIEQLGRDAVEFARFSLQLFDDVVLKNSDYVQLITGDVYVHRTYNMGTVDENNRVNFYDGTDPRDRTGRQ